MTKKVKTSQEVKKAKRISNALSVPQRLFSIEEAAQYLGRPKSSVRGLIWSGRLPYIPEGRRQYVDVRDLDQYIEKNKILML